MEKNCITKYVTDAGQVELSPEIIKSYLVPPDSKITDQEIGFFLQTCKFQKLNPFMKEIYIVKYGNYPAAFITAKDTFLKRAKKNDTYRGHEVGISEDGKTAWAEVYIKDFEKPIRCEVEYDEYVALKDGKPNKMWESKPRTMLKKVSLVQALREAFPQDLGGLYEREEISEPDETIKEASAVVKEAETKSEKKTTEKKPSESPKGNAKETGEVFIKVSKVTKKAVDKTNPQFFIVSVGDTVYSTFDSKIAEEADKIKGSDIEALVLFEIVEKADKTYYNIQKNGFNIQG